MLRMLLAVKCQCSHLSLAGLVWTPELQQAESQDSDFGHYFRRKLPSLALRRAFPAMLRKSMSCRRFRALYM